MLGFVRVRGKIWKVGDPNRFRIVEFLVDTGAIYTVLPSSLLEELGVERKGKRRFKLADGRIVVRDIGFIGIEVNGRESISIVVFGDENVYLLGVTALEELGFEVDPISGRLREMELLLM